MAFELAFENFPGPNGPVRYAHVPWDSQTFGFPFYQLYSDDLYPQAVDEHLPAWLSDLPADRPCLVYTKIPASAVPLANALVDRGFYPVETLFELYLPLASLVTLVHRRHGQDSLGIAEESDLEAVIEVARSSFVVDRYHRDPNLPAERADQRYAEWVERGFRAGELVYIYKSRQKDEVAGFLHVRELAPKTIDLCLGAVRESCQGTGVGALMYQSALMECRERGYRVAIGHCAASNLAILNLITRLGFRFRSAVNTLHWFRAPEK